MFIIAICASPSFADRAHNLAKKASKIKAEICADVQTLEDCHDNYPSGCTKAGKYDAYLSFLKNQTPLPNLQSTTLLAPSDFASLDGNLPTTLQKGNHAVHATALADLGEGNIYTVIGYLYYAQNSGSEACNCQLKRRNETDYHLGIGFDQGIAAQLRNGEKVDDKELKQKSIVAEMTPHYRAKYHPGWNLSTLLEYLGNQVKITGQLMVDNEHISTSETCSRSSSRDEECWRASAWEIHPITQFYVCLSESPCTEDSPDWQQIDNL
jgi:hypothetical protein